MFPYRVKYTVSESDIQNNYLLYTIHQKHQNTFEQKTIFSKMFKKKQEHYKQKMFILYFV
jgi:hypothetical protein